METKQHTSLNVAHNIVNGYYVSTAMWATAISATGMRHPTYETFIWEWAEKDKKRGKMVKRYYFGSRKKAIEFHFRFCRTLAWRQIKKEMPSDSPFIEKDYVLPLD